jgi:hypothetical protein
MNLRILLSVLPRVIGGLVVLFGAAASPALAKHHHLATFHHHGQMPGGTNNIGNNTKSESATKETDTKQDRRDDGKGNTAEETPPEHQGNIKPETNGKGETHSDELGSKSAGSEENPIDTSNTVVGPPNVHAAIARKLKKSAGVRKSWTHRSTTVSKGTTKRSLVRNALGQLVKANADQNRLAGKNDHPPTVNGIHVSTDPRATSGTTAASPNLQPKPAIPLAWSLGRPHGPPPANLASSRGGLSGRSMIRVGAGTGAIGGGANLSAGALDGNSFQPKLP